MVKRIFPLVVRSSRTRRSTKLSHSPNPLPHWYTNAAHYFAHFVAHGKGYRLAHRRLKDRHKGGKLREEAAR